MQYAQRIGEEPMVTQPIVTEKTETYVNQVINITSSEHRNELVTTNDIVVVKFSADWCGPCKKIAESYKQLCHEDNNVVYCSEDVDEDFEGKAEAISSIPCFHIYVNGVFSESMKGANIPKLKSIIDKIKNI